MHSKATVADTEVQYVLHQETMSFLQTAAMTLMGILKILNSKWKRMHESMAGARELPSHGDPAAMVKTPCH